MARQRKPAALKQGKSESKAQLQQRKQIEDMLNGDDDLVYSVPQNLDAKGQVFYQFIVEELRHANILTNIDIPLIEQTADCLSKMRDCDIMLEKNGLFYEELDRYGNSKLVENVAMKTKLNLMTKYSQFCNALGMSPSSRASLASKKIEAKEEQQDPLLKLLKEVR